LGTIYNVIYRGIEDISLGFKSPGDRGEACPEKNPVFHGLPGEYSHKDQVRER
jgi:hypothetical protein